MTVPSFNFDNANDYKEALDIINKDLDLVNNRLLEAIRYGIDNYLLNVYLYEIYLKGGSSYSVKCPRIKWEEALIEAKEFFEEKEEYEKCAEIVKLIVKLNSEEYS